jgi:hypothetical protein
VRRCQHCGGVPAAVLGTGVGAPRGIEQSYSSAAEGIRDFNLRLIGMAHANTMAALDFAWELSRAKGPSEAMALYSSHAQKQFEMMPAPIPPNRAPSLIQD